MRSTHRSRLTLWLGLFFLLLPFPAGAIPAAPEGPEIWEAAIDVVEAQVIEPRRQVGREERVKGFGTTFYEQNVKVVRSYKGALKPSDIVTMLFEQRDISGIPGDGVTSLEEGTH